MSDTYSDLIVVGAGPAGLTAGLYGHRAGMSVLILGGDTPGGQVTMHYRVDNYPGFPGGIPGAQLMANWIKQVMDEIGTMPLPESVDRVDFSGNQKEIVTSLGAYSAKAVILATGARPRQLGVPGEEDLKGHGVFYCATCDAPLLRSMGSRRAAIVGGGDSALHTAMALLPHAEAVTLISRGDQLRAKPVLIDRFTQDPKAEILLEQAVLSVAGQDSVSGLALQDIDSGETRTRPFDAVFVGIGQSPVTEYLHESLELNEHGFVLTDGMLKTSVNGVFAAGDVRDSPLRQIISAASDGALAADSAARYVRMSSG